MNSPQFPFAIVTSFDLGLIMALAGLGTGVLFGVLGMYFHHRRQVMWHETARLALEKGQPVPTAPGQAPIYSAVGPAVAGLHTIEPAARVAVLDQIRSNRSRGYLLGGMINLAVGAGLFLAMQQLARQTAYFAAIPAFVGVALILAAWFESLAGSSPAPDSSGADDSAHSSSQKQMKNLLPPLIAAVLCTGLSVLGCHLNGMPPHELKIAAAVAFAASATAALGATAWAHFRQKLPSQKSSD